VPRGAEETRPGAPSWPGSLVSMAIAQAALGGGVAPARAAERRRCPAAGQGATARKLRLSSTMTVIIPGGVQVGMGDDLGM